VRKLNDTRSEPKPVLLPETKAKLAHNGRISLDATQGIGQKQFSLNAPASSLKKSCRVVKSSFLSSPGERDSWTAS